MYCQLSREGRKIVRDKSDSCINASMELKQAMRIDNKIKGHVYIDVAYEHSSYSMILRLYTPSEIRTIARKILQDRQVARKVAMDV